MITGNSVVKIKEYGWIDHCGEGTGAVRPKDGETIFGHPYQWHSDISWPFIVHCQDGRVVMSVNTMDVSYIIFDEDGV
jgi:hypothetical protein